MSTDLALAGPRLSLLRRPDGPTLTSIIAVCRAWRWLIAGWVVLCMIIATVAVYQLTPLYSARALIQLDTRIQHLDNFQSVMSGPLTTVDTAPIIRTEVHTLQDTALAGKVIDQLKLADSPEFKPHGLMVWLRTNLSIWAKRWLPAKAGSWVQSCLLTKVDPVQARTGLIEQYLNHLSVFNDGQSFTMAVSFWATDPELAARIVNQQVQDYVAEQHTLKQAADERAATWLGRQIDRLQSDLMVKEQADRNLRETSGLVAAQGSTIVAQQAAQVSAALSAARADLAQRQARVAAAKSALSAGGSVQSDVLSSLLIQRLRQQEAETSRVLLNLRSRYKANSPNVLEAQAAVNDVRQKIAQETARIVASMRSDLMIAQDRVSRLTNELKGLQAQLVRQDVVNGRLDDMERDVDAERSVYRDLLSRQQQIEAQVGAESSDARITAPALVPQTPFFPNKKLFLAIGFVLSLGTGIGIALLIDKVRSGGIASVDDLDSVGSTLRLNPVPLVPRRESGGSSLPDYMLDKPTAEFADAVRSLRGDIVYFTHSSGSRVLAITSALPGEGKTTMSLTVARSLASVGNRVLLIDCDLRRSAAAGMLGTSVTDRRGIVAVLRGDASLEDATTEDPRSPVRLLAAGQHVSAPQDLLESAAFKNLLVAARSRYDFVILDTPPAGTVPDALIIGPLVDAMILLVRWKTTPMAAVNRTITALERRGVTLAGMFLNAVNMEAFARASGDYSLYRSRQAYYVDTVRG